jgi:hypothetical protein
VAALLGACTPEQNPIIDGCKPYLEAMMRCEGKSGAPPKELTLAFTSENKRPDEIQVLARRCEQGLAALERACR